MGKRKKARLLLVYLQYQCKRAFLAYQGGKTMSTHTQQTKKRRPHLFICILILLIALACIFVQRFAGTDIYNKASLPSIDFGNENEADGEWCLILVNKWHPLETDSEIDLTELSN